MTDTFFIGCARCGVTLERKLPRKPHLKHFCDGCFDAHMTEQPREWVDDAKTLMVAQAAEISRLRARMMAAEHKLLDHEGKPMLFSQRTEIAAFKAREPLVQEVIRAANGPVDPHWATRVSLAARKLAEWKPT
jgi:hypothetical protein